MFPQNNDHRTLSYVYWPYYCEECVWKLCKSLNDAEKKRAYAVVISNVRKQVLFWHQKASPEEDPIVWDYHVILFLDSDRGWQAWDLASRLPCPISVDEYLLHSFRPDLPVPPEMRPRFRLADADQYQRQLATDRSHMKNEDGSFRAPPPPWPPISQETNLDQWIDMTNPYPGSVLDLQEVTPWLGGRPA